MLTAEEKRLAERFEDGTQDICDYVKSFEFELGFEPFIECIPPYFLDRKKGPEERQLVFVAYNEVRKYSQLLGSTVHLLNDLFCNGPKKEKPYSLYQFLAVDAIGALVQGISPIWEKVAESMSAPHLTRLKYMKADVLKMIEPCRSADWFEEAYNRHNKRTNQHAARAA